MKKKLSSTQILTLELIKSGSIKQHLKSGSYYYMVPSSARRNGKMKISKSTIKTLSGYGLITHDMQLTESGKAIDL